MCTTVQTNATAYANTILTIWKPTSSLGIIYSMIDTPCVQALPAADMAILNTTVTNYLGVTQLVVGVTP